MDLIVLQAGQARQVRVEREGSGWRVRVDEVSYLLDSAAVGPAASPSTLSSLLIDGVQHELSVHRLPKLAAGGNHGAERYGVSGRALSEEIEVIDPVAHLARESRGGAGNAGRDRVTAYMPGRVVAVLVEEGAPVEEGQGVLVLEAMKMENEIAAERAGILGKLFVEPGQAVEGGDPLFEIR